MGYALPPMLSPHCAKPQPASGGPHERQRHAGRCRPPRPGCRFAHPGYGSPIRPANVGARHASPLRPQDILADRHLPGPEIAAINGCNETRCGLAPVCVSYGLP